MYFPHKQINKNIIGKYHFLHNSTFAKRWANEYWGGHRSSLLLPIIGYAGQEVPRNIEKKKLILSVGRLTSEGHCKNHHLIIQAYKSAIDSKLLETDWELVLAGSCDISNRPAMEYYHLLVDLSAGYKVRVEINIEKNTLEKLYKNAFIYVHATGLGLPLDQPEKHEHFGITPHEAMRFGCYPIVYEMGGPADQVMNLDFSSTYSTLDELTRQLTVVSKIYLPDTEMTSAITNYAIENEISNKKNLEYFLFRAIDVNQKINFE